MMTNPLIHIYEKHYKELMVIPFVLLIVSLLILGVSYARTGEFITKGISLKGGISVTFDAPSMSTEELQAKLAGTLKGDVNVRSLGESGRPLFIVEATDTDETGIIAAIRNAGITLESGRYSTETFGSALGESFFRQTIWALIAAFVMMSIVVFITFRKIMPCVYVILAPISTFIMTFATLNLIGLRLSTAGVAAFLMVIGYSVETDILLTTRVLKHKEGTIFSRVLGATKTGLTMTLTAISATTIGWFMTESDVIAQIMLILTIALVYDIINTWLQNAGLLRLSMEKKHEQT
jgi:preprotein translocase subunit SecF